MDTTENDRENADSRSNEPLTDTLEKLKPCRELLEGTINAGWSVIKEIVLKLMTSDGTQNHILSWLLQSKKALYASLPGLF